MGMIIRIEKESFEKKSNIKSAMSGGLIDASALELYTDYSENQLRHIFEPAPGIFIAETPNVIERALDAGYEPLSFFIEDKFLNDKTSRLIERSAAAPVYAADHDTMKSLTGYNITMGSLCAMKRKALPTAEEICCGKSRIAILDDVENPTNVGAIFRSAAALGMEAVVLTSSCADPLYRRAIRVGMGTVFQLPWTIADCPGSKLISDLRQLGFKCAAMALKENTFSIDDDLLKGEEKLAVVLGSEGYGLPDETINACDITVKIPMYNGVDSLNVAAAAAVAFWQLRRRG